MEIKAYTTRGCFYCEKLKELFSRADVEYQMLTVGEDITKEEFLNEYPHVTGYPYVIIDGEIVGGLVETAKLFLQKGLVSSKRS
jgi:glutaredoxin 3